MRRSITRSFFRSSSLDLSATATARVDASPVSPATAAMPLADRIEAVTINVGRALCPMIEPLTFRRARSPGIAAPLERTDRFRPADKQQYRDGTASARQVKTEY